MHDEISAGHRDQLLRAAGALGHLGRPGSPAAAPVRRQGGAGRRPAGAAAAGPTGGAAVLARLDGLVLSGGSDVDPARYGAAAHPAAGPSIPTATAPSSTCARGAGERAAAARHLPRPAGDQRRARRHPATSTCPTWSGNDGHSPERAGYGATRSASRPAPSSPAILGRSEAAVPTHHHQAIDQLGAGLVATAWTDDGVIEAVEFAQGTSVHDRRAVASGGRRRPQPVHCPRRCRLCLRDARACRIAAVSNQPRSAPKNFTTSRTQRVSGPGSLAPISKPDFASTRMERVLARSGLASTWRAAGCVGQHDVAHIAPDQLRA